MTVACHDDQGVSDDSRLDDDIIIRVVLDHLKFSGGMDEF